MKYFYLSIFAILALFAALRNADARDPSVIREFRRLNACPSTKSTRGPCPTHQVDHKVPLCMGGADHLSNLQWLSIADHRAKTRNDVRYCYFLRKSGKTCPKM